MNISELEIGTKLELELYDEDGIRLDYTLVSELEWVNSDNEAIIAAPIHEGVVFPISVGTLINVYFTKTNDDRQQLYFFKAEITGRDKSDNIALLKIKLTSGIQRMQRRKYYRLPCAMQVRYRVIDSMNPERNEGIPFRNTIASNLSGGGIGLLLENKIEIGKLIECQINGIKDLTLTFYGRAIRYEKTNMESRYKYEAGIAFVRINNKDREDLIKHIFSQQRILRKKGLI